MEEYHTKGEEQMEYNESSAEAKGEGYVNNGYISQGKDVDGQYPLTIQPYSQTAGQSNPPPPYSAPEQNGYDPKNDGVVYIPPQPGVPGGPPAPIPTMPRPNPIPGVPVGLEYLTTLDHLLIQQHVEAMAFLTHWGNQNKYVIKNSLEQQVYYAAEVSDNWLKFLQRSSRAFSMHITDNVGTEVIRVTREFKCCAGWKCFAGFDHCAMEVTVEAPVGQIIGKVKQERSFRCPKYGIFDASGERVLGILGPARTCQMVCCRGDVEFKIVAENADEVGKISKQWGGYARERYLKAYNFGANFPKDLDVRMKAVVLGGVFLIAFVNYERRRQMRRRGQGMARMAGRF